MPETEPETRPEWTRSEAGAATTSGLHLVPAHGPTEGRRQDLWALRRCRRAEGTIIAAVLLTGGNPGQLIACTRLKDGMLGTDATGAACLYDEVNQHSIRVFANPLLLSVFSAEVQLSQIPHLGRGFAGPTTGNVLGAAVGQEPELDPRRS